jgi:NDP-sugar pyrophosphorylase family protein
MKDLVAVVLAGGVGKRFWPFVTNKNVFPFLDKPFIEWSVMNSIPSDVKRIVLIANEAHRAFFEPLSFPVPHTIVVQPQAKGMADALLCAKNELSGSRLLILISDHLVDQTLFGKVVNHGQRTQASGVIAGLKVNTYFPGGYLEFDGDAVRGIVEKPEKGKEPSQYVDISGHYIDDSDVLLQELAKTASDKDDIYEKTLTHLMHHSMFVMESYDGISSTLKYPWNVLDVTRDLLQTKVKQKNGKNVVIKSNVVLEGDVWLGDNVKIFENSKIVGPCYIGAHTIIGNNNIVRESIIGEHCVTGFNTDITRSYIGDNCWFHSNYLGDSVLEGDISMGSGAVCANLRLDDGIISSVVNGERISTGRNKLGAMIARGVRIGANTSIMPGVKIGHNSLVSSGVILSTDVPEDSFVEGKTEIKIRKNTGTLIPNARSEFRGKLL